MNGTSSIVSTDHLSSVLQNVLQKLPQTAAATTPSVPSKRCSASGCRVKLGLTAIQCHCGYKFCTAHRYPEEHACSHDYRADAKKELLKTMSTAIVAQKLEKV